MRISANEAIIKANKLVNKYSTRNADRLAEELGVIVKPIPFNNQKGIYKVIERNRFIFIKDDLDPVMHNIVLLHELGHDSMHRKQAITTGGFQEFNIFNMQNNRMEYEANLFAAQVSLPDDEILEYIKSGYDIAQIASAMYSDINLVALKISELNNRGFRLNRQEYNRKFLS